jgi:hypothetical protein
MSQVAERFIDTARTVETVALISLQAEARVQEVCLELVPRADASVPPDICAPAARNYLHWYLRRDSTVSSLLSTRSSREARHVRGAMRPKSRNGSTLCISSDAREERSMNVVTQAPARAIPLPPRASARGDEERTSAAGASLSRPLLAILTVFWIYVALSNVLYASSMSMEFDPDGTNMFFARWDARILQHVLLFPLLLGAIWISLRVGWRPAWRALPIQLLLGLVFSVAASPLLHDSELLMKAFHGHSFHPWMSAGPEKHEKPESLISPGWVGSATSFFLTYGFAVALVTGFALYQRFRDSELRLAALERAWNGARLAALRMQLSPHTLFNLLHTIRGHIGWDPAAAQSMIVQLGDLLRRLLSAGARDFSRLRDELDFARLYLELQQRRFADRLNLVLPDAASLPYTWVPSLILQPLIENAVTHGLADHVGRVTVRVEITASEEALTLRVVNTMAPGRARQPDGVGLRNVRDRLAVHFGDRATFDARAAGDAEWVAQIQMPLLGEGPRSGPGEPR